jgi:hypothetical protein
MNIPAILARCIELLFDYSDRKTSRRERLAQPAVLFGAEEHCSSGKIVTSKRSVDTSIRQKRALPSSYRFLADAVSCPGNCSGIGEATGAPSSVAVFDPKRLRASGRDGGVVMTQPPSPLTMPFSRHTKRHRLAGTAAQATFVDVIRLARQPGLPHQARAVRDEPGSTSEIDQ